MRIGDTKVVQLVESEPPKLVIVDEMHMEEITFVPDEVKNLAKAIAYFTPALQKGKV